MLKGLSNSITLDSSMVVSSLPLAFCNSFSYAKCTLSLVTALSGKPMKVEIVFDLSRLPPAPLNSRIAPAATKSPISPNAPVSVR